MVRLEMAVYLTGGQVVRFRYSCDTQEEANAKLLTVRNAVVSGKDAYLTLTDFDRAGLVAVEQIAALAAETTSYTP